MGNEAGPLGWDFRGSDGEPFMRICPADSECCYRLQEWGETKKKDGSVIVGWKPMELYPHTFASALGYVKRFMLMRQGGSTGEVKAMQKALAATEKRIMDALDAGAAERRRVTGTCASCWHYRVTDDLQYCDRVHQLRGPKDFCSKWKEIDDGAC